MRQRRSGEQVGRCLGCASQVTFARSLWLDPSGAETWLRTCPACGNGFRVEPDLNYVEHDRHMWIAALPVARYVEFLTPSPYIDRLVKNPMKPDAEGHLHLPDGPGLGIELDEEAMADKIGHDWRNPRSFHPDDGAAIDW